MLRSKALKTLNRFIRKDFEDFGFWKGLYYRVICPPIDLYHRYTERICRTLAFARKAWLHYDFDSAYLWDIMAFKLKRIEKCLINGHAIQEAEDMAAIKESIQICERLFGEDYEDPYWKIHDAKWGEMLPWDTEPADKDKDGKILTYRILTKPRPNVKTPEDTEQERKDFLQCFQSGEDDRLKDMDRLAFLLKTYSRKWWD